VARIEKQAKNYNADMGCRRSTQCIGYGKVDMNTDTVFVRGDLQNIAKLLRAYISNLEHSMETAKTAEYIENALGSIEYYRGVLSRVESACFNDEIQS
jgi:hypothetical protein